VVQVVKHLLSKCEALEALSSSKPSTTERAKESQRDHRTPPSLPPSMSQKAGPHQVTYLLVPCLEDFSDFKMEGNKLLLFLS
jgi:hypothetical protein